jgi:hypothetical protein
MRWIWAREYVVGKPRRIDFVEEWDLLSQLDQWLMRMF